MPAWSRDSARCSSMTSRWMTPAAPERKATSGSSHRSIGTVRPAGPRAAHRASATTTNGRATTVPAANRSRVVRMPLICRAYAAGVAADEPRPVVARSVPSPSRGDPRAAAPPWWHRAPTLRGIRPTDRIPAASRRPDREPAPHPGDDRAPDARRREAAGGPARPCRGATGPPSDARIGRRAVPLTRGPAAAMPPRHSPEAALRPCRPPRPRHSPRPCHSPRPATPRPDSRPGPATVRTR